MAVIRATEKPAASTDAMIGHNNPPTDAEIEAARQHEKHGELLDRADRLIEAIVRMPTVIENEDHAAKVTDFGKSLGTSSTALDTIRKAEVQPHLNAQRNINGIFNSKIDMLEKAKTAARKLLSDWLTKKENEARIERERAAEIARQSAEAAQRLAEAAAQESAPDLADAQADVTVALELVDTLEAAAEAPVAVSSRGAFGSSSSITRTWKGSFTDASQVDLNTLRAYIATDAIQKALNAYVKAGGRQCPGTIIEQVSNATIR